MKQFVFFIILALGVAAQAQAQNYLDHLKQQSPGKGTISVHQSKAIDELVNGKPVAMSQTGKSVVMPQTDKPKTNPISKNTTPTTPDHKRGVDGKLTTEHKVQPVVEHNKPQTTQPARKPSAAADPDSIKKQQEQRRETAADNKKEETETPMVDMRKKVMRGSYKVTGYRVQAFAGGNSRADRQKAEQIGNEIKMRYPDQPVYVHFYSPRWICRIGNYRSLAEAQRMLSKVRAMGYRQACLVKGKITVQN